jgi:hypothetical protein
MVNPGWAPSPTCNGTRLAGLPAAGERQRAERVERQRAERVEQRKRQRRARDRQEVTARVKRTEIEETLLSWETTETRQDKVRRNKTNKMLREEERKRKRKRKRDGRRLLIRMPSTPAKTTLFQQTALPPLILNPPAPALDPHSCPCIRIPLPALPAQLTIAATAIGHTTIIDRNSCTDRRVLGREGEQYYLKFLLIGQEIVEL